MKHRAPQTKRVRSKTHVQDTAIRDLPLSVFRIPPSEWILSFRRMDGTRETRKIRGTLFDARAHRDASFKTGRYSECWIEEGKNHRTKKLVTGWKGKRIETSLKLAVVFDSESYYTKEDFG